MWRWRWLRGAGCKALTQSEKAAVGRKQYLRTKSLKEVRSLFYTRVQMQPFGGNYSNDKRFQRTNWMCRCGVAKEQEEHMMEGECPVYGDIRKEFPDTMEDGHMDDLFTLILERRKRLEEEENSVEDVLAIDTMIADVASLRASQFIC